MFPASWISVDSPLNDPLLVYAFCASLLVQHGLFHLLSATLFSGSSPAQLKKRCWILTTLNAAATTLASLPYLWDFFGHSMDFGAIQQRTPFTHAVCAFFVAYLVSDLGLGFIYYRKLINVSSGWVHHTVYTLLFTFWVHKGWGHIAVMACVFELPTFIMGIASLHPPLRSNNAFTSTFFLTRVFLHIALLFTSITPHGRSAPGIDGSWGPCISIAVILPMHLWWGWKCILSVRRRMLKRKLAVKAEREKQANEFAHIAAQAFNGFQAPDTSSAVNTPLPTPGGSPMLSATTLINHGTRAFSKAAAASKGPMNLVLGRSKSSTSISDTIPPLDLASSTASSSTLLQVPVCPPLQRSRSSADAVRSARHLTAPVPPEGIKGDRSREPFLAIRSPAESQDRARRLVADAVRKLWFGAPESWRRHFEEEALQMELHRPSRRAESSAVESSERSDTDAEETSVAQRNFGEAAMTTATAEEKSRGQKARALLRRVILRAVRRAINGKTELKPMASADGEYYSQSDDEVILARTQQETDRALSNLDLTSILKLSGLPLPPDLLGDPYEVRPLNMERREGERRTRLVDDLRRRMEVRNRDFVIWDD